MNCIVTTGPTYEELDRVRRLTNFSSGKLGTHLADFLTEAGDTVTLLRGYYSTYSERGAAASVIEFTTIASLADELGRLSGKTVDAVFHAAAVADFSFGKVFYRTRDQGMMEIESGKFSTEQGILLAELIPTPKVIGRLRNLFPDAFIAGWKYEVEGTREAVVRKALQQIEGNGTNVCVPNGPAYGFGFGLVEQGGKARHFSDTRELFAALRESAMG